MPPKLPPGTRFEVPTGKTSTHKYVAHVPSGHTTIHVRFGSKDYEQYKDSVPPSMGGGEWSFMDHGDEGRRERYRKRASGQRCKNGRRCIDNVYSPAWFSYHFLW